MVIKFETIKKKAVEELHDRLYDARMPFSPPIAFEALLPAIATNTDPQIA